MYGIAEIFFHNFCTEPWRYYTCSSYLKNCLLFKYIKKIPLILCDHITSFQGLRNAGHSQLVREAFHGAALHPHGAPPPGQQGGGGGGGLLQPALQGQAALIPSLTHSWAASLSLTMQGASQSTLPFHPLICG
jgi:hypothetical protein